MIKPMLFLTAALFAAPVLAQAAPAALPPCSATVKDACQQTKGQEARAMSGAQADARDAKSGAWTPNAGMSDKDAPAPMKKKAHHKAAKKTVTTTTTTDAAPK